MGGALLCPSGPGPPGGLSLSARWQPIGLSRTILLWGAPQSDSSRNVPYTDGLRRRPHLYARSLSQAKGGVGVSGPLSISSGGTWFHLGVMGTMLARDPPIARNI